MIDVDTTSFLLIVVAGTVAAFLVTVVPRRLAPPVVVVELLLGIVIGPQVLGVAHVDAFTTFFSNLGLGLLFFFAGYDLDLRRLQGRPLGLGVGGWAISIALGYAFAGLLVALDVVASLLYVGSALATTAIGTLVPILRDAEETEGRFATLLLAAGAAGEFGPVLLVTLVLSAQDPVDNALLLVAFVGVGLAIALVSVRTAARGWTRISDTLESSGQLGIRLVTLLIFGLAALASEFGLDVLLGGFVAGMIVAEAVRGRRADVLESKLGAVGFGLLVPFFFVTSGMRFDVGALGEGAALAEVPLFLALMLVVRGTPALLLYRRDLAREERHALGFFSATALPLVVAITAVAQNEGHMNTATAAALVGAAILSTLLFPFAGLAWRRRGRTGRAAGVR